MNPSVANPTQSCSLEKIAFLRNARKILRLPSPSPPCNAGEGRGEVVLGFRGRIFGDGFYKTTQSSENDESMEWLEKSLEENPDLISGQPRSPLI
jgi:hypothetical protein